MLNQLYQHCVENSYEYLMLVHDDNGSGNLKQYYKQRGFNDIDDIVPKGMLAKLGEK
jgi:hypothetical protein